MAIVVSLQSWISLKSQDDSTADEAARSGLSCQDQKISFLQGREGQNYTKSAATGFFCRKTESEMGNGCYRIHSVRTKLYLSTLLNLHSSYLISYTISEHSVLRMVTSMLDKAFEIIPNIAGLILHSDQRWQYQNKYYRQMLKQKGIHQSMNRKGNCLDNTIMENFFGLRKSELLYLQKLQSIEHFKQELVEYWDYYNNYQI